MITLLHGDDILRSRKNLDELKSRKDKREIINLDGRKVTLEDLKQAFETKSLFGQDKLVVLENFLSRRKKGRDKEAVIEYLNKEKLLVDLFLWEEEEVSQQTLRIFPEAEVKIFKLDPLLFRFLDSLKPGNSKTSIELFRQALSQEETNLIFYMLIRQFRLFLLFGTKEKVDLDEVKRLAEWQKAKISKQAQLFNLKKLLSIYHEILEIDYGEKGGFSAYPLRQTLELFLSKL